jgi:hypothetical protein
MASLWALGFEFGFGIVASVFGLAGGPVELAILECEAAVGAEIFAAQACDPDPCRIRKKYWLLAEPQVPRRRYACRSKTLRLLFEGPITAETVKLFQLAVDENRKIPAFELAVFETCSRVYSARKKSDIESEQSQKRYKQWLINDTLSLKRDVSEHWEHFLVHCKTSGLIGRPVPAYEHLLDLLKRKGFPEVETSVMRSYGLTDKEIDQVRFRILKEFDSKDAPRTVEEAILANIICYRHSDFSCNCK